MASDAKPIRFAVVGAGMIGELARSHYSIMGYLPRARQMLAESVPPIIERLQAEQVDLVLLVPV